MDVTNYFKNDLLLPNTFYDISSNKISNSFISKFIARHNVNIPPILVPIRNSKDSYILISLLFVNFYNSSYNYFNTYI